MEVLGLFCIIETRTPLTFDDDILNEYSPFPFSYKKRAEKVARLFQDRPMAPLDTAIYWMEHVIRHGGGAHLKPASLDLYWWQYILLDVILTLILLTFLLVWAVKYTVQYVINTYYSTAEADEKKRN